MTPNRDLPPRTGVARALSKLGFCSRLQAFELVRNGRVRLNGRLVRDPETPVRLAKDKLEVDAVRVEPAKKIYLMLNKPRGVVTTASDERGRKTVYSLLPQHQQWLAPVGRLDMASEGLLLLTNDSAWAARIASPQAHVQKTYHVQIAFLPDQNLLDRLLKGVDSAREILEVKRATVLRTGAKNSWLQIILDEGRNRHIRRMFEHLGIDVLRLVRVGIGPLQLGDLPKGKSRQLSRAEVEQLRATGRTIMNKK